MMFVVVAGTIAVSSSGNMEIGYGLKLLGGEQFVASIQFYILTHFQSLCGLSLPHGACQ